jgi:hypothetical protein
MIVYIVAQAVHTTGGQELLHQFSKALSDRGIENYMLYFNGEGLDCPVAEPYKKYDVKYVDEYIDSADSVLVLAEGLLGMLNRVKCEKGTLMVWWLSVDNYLSPLQSTGTVDDENLDVFGLKLRENAVHFVQSYYAKDFLEKRMDIAHCYFLMDYINDDIEKIASMYRTMSYRRQDICLFNPRKGYEDLRPVIEACRKNIRWIPLVGYKASEMAALMCLSKVYVDFGPHPGKDRIPREAAMCGCCIMTNRRGSAAYSEDVGIPEQYKVDDMEDIDGILQRLYILVDHYEEEWKGFSDYRNAIASEKAGFMRDLDTALMILENCVEDRKKRALHTCDNS